MSSLLSRIHGRGTRPAVVAMAFALLLTLVAAHVAMAAALGQDAPAYVLPTWFVGLFPVIVYILEEVIFRGAERAGKPFSGAQKNNAVWATSILMAISLIVTGAVPLPTELPTTFDLGLWGAFLTVVVLYAWAGAKLIHDAIDALRGAGKPPVEPA